MGVPQAKPEGLMSIGAVAAHNLVIALDLPQSAVGKIEQAIKDEINAMSSHFTLAVADVRDQFEVKQLQFEKDVAAVKSTYNWLRAHAGRVVGAGIGLFVLGVVVGYFV